MVRLGGVPALRVVESTTCSRSYHLRVGDDGKTLCGIEAVPTAIPVTSWGTVSHVRERWCKYCAELGVVETKPLRRHKSNKSSIPPCGRLSR
jgi:hypothetical protein